MRSLQSQGGAIASNGTLVASGITAANVTATAGSGGALWAATNAAISASTFDSATATIRGGAVFAGAAASVNGSAFTQCAADRGGGGAVFAPAVSLAGSWFRNVSASGAEGGGAVLGAVVAATLCQFDQCGASSVVRNSLPFVRLP